MSQSRPLYLGPRLRRLRRELGLTQQGMAGDLDVSPSYVALLERNQRPVTAELLLRLARTYQIDVSELASEDADDYARRISDVMRDPLLGDIDLPALEIADLATSFPGVAEAILRLHGAYAREQQALADRRLGGGAREDATPDPVRLAQQFFADNRNHFPTLDTKAEELAGEIAEHGAAGEWLRKAKGVRVRFLPPEVMVDSVRRYDRHNEQLLIDDTLDTSSRKFQLALHIAWTTMRDEIGQLARAAELPDKSAVALVRRNLAAYAAAALVMPYDRFLRAADSRGYDVAALAGLFGMSFEQVAHRLTTLARPGHDGSPFFMARIDAAGTASKLLDGGSFPYPAQGGACPLWRVHDTFRTPGQLVTQWLELPDGRRFFSLARTVGGEPRFHGAPAVTRAVALVCAAEHAPKLIYARGTPPETAPATPIGVTCRLCQRAECEARAVPPLGRELLADDQRRSAVPFMFADR